MHIRKTIIAASSLVILIAMFLAACGSANKSLKPAPNDGVDIFSSMEEHMETWNPSALTRPETTEESKPEEATTGKVQTSSENWQDLTFVMDGKEYKIPLAFIELEADGWSIGGYDASEGYVMNPGDRTYGTTELSNDSFQGTRVTVGFVNPTEETLDIADCALWSFSVDTSFAQETRPNITLAKGITWGSSKEDVVRAYGDPSDTFDSEDGSFDTLTFGSSWEGTGGVMKLTFTDNALVGIELEQN